MKETVYIMKNGRSGNHLTSVPFTTFLYHSCYNFDTTYYRRRSRQVRQKSGNLTPVIKPDMQHAAYRPSLSLTNDKLDLSHKAQKH